MSLTCSDRSAARRRRELLYATLRALHRHRFMRFLVVGGLNTAFGYGLFLLSLMVLPTTFLALCTSTLLGILFNFLTTGSYVFGSRDPRRLPRFYAVYALIFLYNSAGLAILAREGVEPRLAALLLLPGAVATSWVLNNRLVFKRG